METFLPRQFFICSGIELLLTTIPADFAFVKDPLMVMESEHIRNDYGSEFTAQEVCKLLDILVVKTPLVELRGRREKSYVESFGGTITHELLNREQIDTLWEAKVLCGNCVRHSDTNRPYSALGYRPSAPAARLGPPSNVPSRRSLRRPSDSGIPSATSTTSIGRPLSIPTCFAASSVSVASSGKAPAFWKRPDTHRGVIGHRQDNMCVFLLTPGDCV